MTPRPIVFVEDQADDFEMAARSFRRLGLDIPVVRVETVEGAGRYLEEPAGDDLPGTIVLDLRLPDGDGREVLAAIRRNPRFENIPVVIWTASSDPAVVDDCYQRGANACLRKQARKDRIDEVVRQFGFYWLQAVLPNSN